MNVDDIGRRRRVCGRCYTGLLALGAVDTREKLSQVSPCEAHPGHMALPAVYVVEASNRCVSQWKAKEAEPSDPVAAEDVALVARMTTDLLVRSEANWTDPEIRSAVRVARRILEVVKEG